MAVIEQKLNPIVLDCRQKDQQVMVSAENEDRFFISVEKAARACQIADPLLKIQQQINALLQKLAGWILTHKSKIHEAFLTVRDGGFLFVLIQKSPYLDLDFEEELTNLDLEVTNSDNFNSFRFNVLGLPATTQEAYNTFLDLRLLWIFNHAKLSGSH